MTRPAPDDCPPEALASGPTVEDEVLAYLNHFWKVDAWLHALQRARVDPL